MNFAEALRVVRQKKRLSMIAVAELTGIPLPIYKMIEHGRILPDCKKLDALCGALNISLMDDELIGGN